MGWTNTFHCEIDPFCQRILKYYWPHAHSYTDITQTTFYEWRGRIDVLTGGFPCQPFSAAGKQQGTKDSRYLWPDMLRAIREIRPRWIVGENVLGLVSWNGGLVFDTVCADLEAQGYEVQPYLLPACGINAPHKRERVWFVAYASGCGVERDRATGQQVAPVPAGPLLPRRNYAGNYWDEWPTEAPIYNGDDGLSARLDAITFSKWRKESIKGGGNAVVPQVALQIFKTIERYENPAFLL